jgi:hypothetical protein
MVSFLLNFALQFFLRDHFYLPPPHSPPITNSLTPVPVIIIIVVAPLFDIPGSPTVNQSMTAIFIGTIVEDMNLSISGCHFHHGNHPLYPIPHLMPHMPVMAIGMITC